MHSPPLDRRATGVYPISITPFLDDGRIDYESVDRLIDFFLHCQVAGITVLGLLGEASKLSFQESITLLEHVIHRVDGRVGVISGVSHVGFDEIHRYCATAMDAGVSGIMIAPGAGLKTEDQVLSYFDALFRSIGEDVPVALQDYPQSTGVFVSATTLGTLVQRHAAIKVIKHEEASALRKISQLRAQEADAERERVAILVGNSAIHLPQELRRGADGANTGVAFPEMLVEVCKRHFSGAPDAAEDLYDSFLPLIRHEQQPGIGLAIRKEIFRRRGLIKSARLRRPGPMLDSTDHAELTSLLDRLSRKLRDSGESKLIDMYPVQEGV